MSPMVDAQVVLDADCRAIFPSQMPVFAGHFPHDPVVPGVHQLALIVTLVQRQMGTPWTLQGVVQAKWPALVRPVEPLTVSATWTQDGDRLHVSGRVMRGDVVTCVCRLLLRSTSDRG